MITAGAAGAAVCSGASRLIDKDPLIRSYDVYGVVLASEFDFANPLPAAAEGARPDVVFTCTEAPVGVVWDEAEVVAAEGRRTDGDPDFEFVRFAGHDAVRITGAADFHVHDDRIHCHLRDARHRYLVEIALLEMVFALWFERRGTPTLHAAVAVVEGSAVGFLGVKGGGKTTSVAACVAAGHRFLTDDLLALTQRDGAFCVQRGVPALRLWPQQLENFVGEGWERLPVIRPDHLKRRVDLPGHRFAGGPAPLGRLYLPERLASGDVTLQRLPPQEAVIELVRHSFLPREVQRYGWQATRLQTFSRLVAGVPVARLRYPSGLDRLDEVVSAVVDDVRGR